MGYSSDSFSEDFFLRQILPQFNVILNNLKWEGHFDMNPDATAHFFSTTEGSFVLVFEDYPLVTLAEVQDLVRNYQTLHPVVLKESESVIYDFEPKEGGQWDRTPAGSFKLYRVSV